MDCDVIDRKSTHYMIATQFRPSIERIQDAGWRWRTAVSFTRLRTNRSIPSTMMTEARLHPLPRSCASHNRQSTNAVIQCQQKEEEINSEKER